MRGRKEPDTDEIPVLPPFPSESFDVTVQLSDGTTDVCKVMARGQAQAIMTAVYTMQRWPPEKIILITGLTLTKR